MPTKSAAISPVNPTGSARRSPQCTPRWLTQPRNRAATLMDRMLARLSSAAVVPEAGVRANDRTAIPKLAAEAVRSSGCTVTCAPGQVLRTESWLLIDFEKASRASRWTNGERRIRRAAVCYVVRVRRLHGPLVDQAAGSCTRAPRMGRAQSRRLLRRLRGRVESTREIRRACWAPTGSTRRFMRPAMRHIGTGRDLASDSAAFDRPPDRLADTGRCPAYCSVRASLGVWKHARVQRRFMTVRRGCHGCWQRWPDTGGRPRSPTPRDTSYFHDRRFPRRAVGLFKGRRGCLSPRRC